MINEKIIFECVVGSHAYGTNIETSDIDIKGVYQQPNPEILGFNYKQQIEVDKDTTYYEIKRFIELAASANPTILEMLFVDDKFIKANTPQFQILRDHRDLFLTKRCANSFGGYAVGQIKKAKGLNKKMNWEKEKTVRKTPIDFCYIKVNQGSVPILRFLDTAKMHPENCGIQAIDHMPNCYALYYDWSKDYADQTSTKEYYKGFGYKGFGFEDSNDLKLSSIPKEQANQSVGIFYYNKDAYSIHCKEYNEYQTWLANRNVARYVDVVAANLDKEQKIDSKNLMHCMRLIGCGLEIASCGDFCVFRADAKWLLQIRRGEISLDDIIQQAEENLIEMDKLFKKSRLPDEFDMNKGHELLLKIRQWTPK